MGHLVVYGALGAMTATTPLPLWALFRRTVRMYAGYKVFDFMGNRNMGIPRNQSAAERASKFLLEGLESGAFTARIDRVFEGLDQYADAHRCLESNAQSFGFWLITWRGSLCFCLTYSGMMMLNTG